jgi:hypothetical protein
MTENMVFNAKVPALTHAGTLRWVALSLLAVSRTWWWKLQVSSDGF